jgi:hypothetical protein
MRTEEARPIPGVSSGVVFRVDPTGRQAASPLAVWGEDAQTIPALTTAAGRAVATGCRVVMRYAVDSRLYWAIALPVQAEGRVVATIALALAPRPANEMLRLLQQLEGEAGLFEALAL